MLDDEDVSWLLKAIMVLFAAVLSSGSVFLTRCVGFNSLVSVAVDYCTNDTRNEKTPSFPSCDRSLQLVVDREIGFVCVNKMDLLTWALVLCRNRDRLWCCS